MKKMVKVLTAIVLSASLVVGCSATNTTKSSSPSQTEPSGGTSNSKFEEKLSLEIMSITYEGGGWPDKHPIIDYLNKKFNVDLKFQWVPTDTYVEKLGVLAASNSFPDAYYLSLNDFLKWREKGIFLDVKPMLADYPELASFLPERAFAIGNPADKTYGLPIYTPESRETLVIRKDWLENLGLGVPTTTDEFYNVAKAFTFDDPDQNGEHDTVGISTSINNDTLSFGRLSSIEFAFGLANSWKEINGELVPKQVQNQEWKDFLGFMKKAYNEGILDKDFSVNKHGDPSLKAEASKVGILELVATAIYAEGSQGSEPTLKQVAPEAEWLAIAPPKGPNGIQGGGTAASSNKIVINSKIDKKKQERILAILEFLITDEGDILNKNGLEGIHYQKTADGKFEKLPQFEIDRPTILGMWFFRKANPIITGRIWDDPSYKERIDGIFAVNEKYPNLNDGIGIHSETSAKLNQSLNQKLMSEFVTYIVNDVPEESIDKAIDEWRKNGGDQIIKEMNDAAKLLK